MNAPLVLRADAGPSVGAGHVVRCLALAQAWGDAVFVCAGAGPGAGLEALLEQEGFRAVRIDADVGSAIDAAKTVEIAGKVGASWVVVDGYGFRAVYEQSLRDTGLRVLALDDDIHEPSHCADIVLNHGSHAVASMYAGCASWTTLLLGAEYALLRSEFADAAKLLPRPIPETVHRVVVALGGGAYTRPARVVLEALAAVRDSGGAGNSGNSGGLEFEAVACLVGAPEDELAQLRAEMGMWLDVRGFANDIPALLRSADFAILGGGGTNWEAAALGLPAAVVTLADNQRPIVADLSRLGVVESLGDGENLDAAAVASSLLPLFADTARRRSMAERGRALVDGRGASRVAAAMRAMEGAPACG